MGGFFKERQKSDQWNVWINFPDSDRRHGSKAKNGWYRYDTRFGIPVYSELGEIDRYNIFRARMLVRCDDRNKLYLYDIVQIKKETSTPLE
jgi:hypothetical protein